MLAIIKNEWVHCPFCNKKNFQKQELTNINNLEYSCKACKNIFHVIVVPRARSQVPQRAKSQ